MAGVEAEVAAEVVVVGAEGVEFVLGRHSGRRAVAHRLAELGLSADDPTVERILEAIKSLPKGTVVDEAQLRRLVAQESREATDSA